MAAPAGNEYWKLRESDGMTPMYETPEQLSEQIEAYFRSLSGIDHTEPTTITGLALFLGFASRQSFYDYEKKEGFAYIIKRARMRVEQAYEKNLQRADLSHTGSIFALKNMGWTDRQEISHSGIPDPAITVNIERPKDDDE